MSHLKVGLNEDISLDTVVAGKTQSQPIELEQYINSVQNIGFFDTGLLSRPDTGLINYRRAAGWESFIFQVEAGEHMVIWGQYEGDRSASRIKVAMPYRIIMGDHKFHQGKWHLIGARHFYSPKPIKSWQDILYHCNVPNLNCRGYGGTGVGWICLYHKDDYSKYDLMGRILTTCMRTAGGEAYNDDNMSRTDGTRFYQAAGKPSYFSSKKGWVEKTKKEGWKWVLEDPELLIPVKLNNPAVEMMSKHISSGKNASVFDLSRGLYSAYYNDSMHLKPANLMDPNNPFVKLYPKKQKTETYKYIKEFANSTVTQIKSVKVFGWTPKVVKLTCAFSKKQFSEDEKWQVFVDSDNVLKLIHSSVVRENSNRNNLNIVTGIVNGRLIKQDPSIPPEIVSPGSYPRSNDTMINMLCRVEDTTQDGTSPGSYSRWYHKTVEFSKCTMCHNVATKGSSRWNPDNKDICRSCKDKVKCPCCTRVVRENALRTVDYIEHDITGTNDFKRALEKALEEGLQLDQLPSMRLGMSDKRKVVCCIYCEKSLVQCLCGNIITKENITSLRTTMTKVFAPTCSNCNEEPQGEMKLAATVVLQEEVFSDVF